MLRLFWPSSLMPNLLAVRQSRDLFNFGQYELFIDCIFHVLHTQARSRKKGREVAIQLCLCFPSNHIDLDGDCPE